MIKTIKILVVLIICISCTSKKKEALIESFFNDVFITENKTGEELHKEYIYIETDRPLKDKLLFFNEGVRILKETNPLLSDKKENLSFTITKYTESDYNDLIPFYKEIIKDVYVITAKSKVIAYVLMKEDKIYAFNTLQKGSQGPGYFISDFN